MDAQTRRRCPLPARRTRRDEHTGCRNIDAPIGRERDELAGRRSADTQIAMPGETPTPDRAIRADSVPPV